MNDSSTTVTNAAAPAAGAGNLDDFLGAPPARPWWRRPKWILAALGLVALLFLLSRCFAGEAGGGYATETARRGNLTVTVSATGNLQPTNQVEVGSEQSGLVTQVFVDNNDRVTVGQPLARLDTSRLQDTIVQAQAGLAAAQAQVATAEASAAQARANLARQEEVFRLSGGRVPSETELDSARAENRRAIAGVRAAQAQVAQARAQLSSAQTNLSKATIYSPVTGVVLSRQIDPGQTVAASFQAPVLFTIAEDLAAMELEVRVDEADVGQVSEGQRATFTVDAYPGRTFEAQVNRVDVGANASGTASGSTASATTGSVVAYTAALSVQNPELLLRPGMTATAEIVTTERRNVLLVPNAALRFSPEQGTGQQKSGVTSVLVPRGPRGMRGRPERQVSIGRGSRQTIYVVSADGNPQPVQVVVGESDGSQTEIVGGDLRPGMEVITARLAAGQTQDRGSRRGGEGSGGGNGERNGGGRGGDAPAAAPAGQAPARQGGQGAAQEGGASGGR
ncbi:efflux RND transporter periplasmic adaptor subunit [Sphingosinicella terrae]|uniref:efflux RND transporter periplasmic adaptor subunit n=1 Tax=Sphingosinicella terrae TaxID=2172047 RepID=UPI000E0D1435|nr:efflux RND transporter periplasmic adaptor subunit [Sphingosinicella terrae]